MTTILKFDPLKLPISRSVFASTMPYIKLRFKKWFKVKERRTDFLLFLMNKTNLLT